MLIYVKLLLQDLFRLSEVLHLLVANVTGASHALSPVFCCLPHARTFFLGTAHGGNDLSPRLPALPALKWAHIVAFSTGTWGPGTKVSIPEQVFQNLILRPATPANTWPYCCARLLKITFLMIKSLNSKETCKCVLC